MCLQSDFVDGKEMVADETYIPSNVSKARWMDVEQEVEKSMQSYLKKLGAELMEQPGFKKPTTYTVIQKHTTSQIDPDCRVINHGAKRGIGYLMEAPVD